tara:strand:- start:2705 stop:5173 length:2469 start_codon:yes stop_codon:yes gene_type:complete
MPRLPYGESLATLASLKRFFRHPLTSGDKARRLQRLSFQLGTLKMNTQQLFHALNSRSLRVRLRPDRRLEVIGDLSKLTDDMKTALRDNRQMFLDLLDQDDPSESIGQSVRLGSEEYAFDVWGLSEQLLSPIAIDTETELIDGRAVPRIALASVSDGKRHRLIRPVDLQAFIDAHRDCHFVAHNASFDFAVIRQALADPSGWVEVADQGRLHDTMLLDSLIRLARDDSYPRSVDLGSLAANYLKIEIDKEDPFRLRYAELLDRPWDQADPGFFTYAVKDAIVTWKLWQTLTAIAEKLVKPFESDFFPGWRKAWGLLTESLQVRGAIALSEIERNGIALDQSQVESTKAKLSSEVETLIDSLAKLPAVLGLFKRSKTGSLIATASGKPSTNRDKLIELLESIADDLDIDAPRTGKTKAITTSIKFWGQYAERSKFLSLWVQLEETAKLCQFFAGLKSDRIHPRYTTLVRTGRTSCSGPNVQQLPRSGGFREMIVPSAGHYFLTIDYSAIELRTLAAVCERRFGRSQLAEVIREGVDPHSFTASMFEGVSIDDFATLPNKKQLRQRAKALNFGIPGGLGAKSLVAYAATTYGVDMTIEEAEAFREKLIGQVYPELGEYLQDDPVAALAHNLKTSGFRIGACFDTDGTLGAAKRIVAGCGKANGKDYGEAFVDRVWESFKTLNQNPKLKKRIADRNASEQLSRDLFYGPVATLTGRIRGAVGFSQARNTPFQGLAADGAKLALWGLYIRGFRCVAFVHDEVVIELPIDAEHTQQAREIDKILCESMATLTGTIPIACEYSLADRWYKQAEAVFSEEGKLQLWGRE